MIQTAKRAVKRLKNTANENGCKVTKIFQILKNDTKMLQKSTYLFTSILGCGFVLFSIFAHICSKTAYFENGWQEVPERALRVDAGFHGPALVRH